MKYLTYETIAAANDWIEQTESENKKAEEHYWKLAAEYQQELETIKHRVSKPAWIFFRHGFAEKGLHDGQLLAFEIGDNMIYSPEESAFETKRGTTAKIRFLSWTGEFQHIFELRDVKTSRINIIIDEDLYNRNIGDLFTYELTGVDDRYLQLGFVFAAGSEMTVVFRKLIYKRIRNPKSKR